MIFRPIFLALTVFLAFGQAQAIPDIRSFCEGLLKAPQKVMQFFKVPTLDAGATAVTSGINLPAYYAPHHIYPVSAPDPNLQFSLNVDGDLQMQNWYPNTADLFTVQQRWQLNVPEFITSEGATNFNEAKKKFFSRLPFDPKKMRFLRPYSFLREWGGLNHPPIVSLDDAQLTQFSEHYGPQDSKALDKSPYFDPEFHINLDQVSRSELSKGNSFQLLADKESADAKIRHVYNANKSIWISSLAFINDQTVGPFVEALIEAYNNGIDVRIMAEGSLSWLHGSLFRKMRRAGIPIVLANDYRRRFTNSTVYHVKVFIVDEELVHIGGQNMIDADMGSNGVDLKNRDLDVEMRGPIVSDVILNFMEDWNHFVLNSFSLLYRNGRNPAFADSAIAAVKAQMAAQRAAGLRGRDHYAKWLSDPNQRMNGLARFVAQKPRIDIGNVTNALIPYIDGVKKYMAVTNPLAVSRRGRRTPHFNRLQDAIERMLNLRPEVHLDYITSGRDFGLNEATPMTVDRIRCSLKDGNVFWANLNQSFLDVWNPVFARSSYRNLTTDYVPRNNVDAWIHLSFIHSKIWYFDRIVASIGSMNFNANATDHSYEVTAFIQDAAFNRQIDQALVLDMANSVPFSPGHCKVGQ